MVSIFGHAAEMIKMRPTFKKLEALNFEHIIPARISRRNLGAGEHRCHNFVLLAVCSGRRPNWSWM